MISLLEIAQSINEDEDDKYVSIGFGRFKLKGKEDDDDADVYAKTDSGKYVKSADQKSDDDGGKKPEEPQGGKLSGSDFDRDGGDSEKVDGPSPEDDWDNEQVMTAKIGGEEVGNIIDNPNHPNYDKAMDYVMSFNPDDEKLVTGPGSDIDGPSPEDDWDNEQVMTAKINGEEVGDIINNPNHTNYDKAMDYVMSFNPDDEKLVTGPGSDDNAESEEQDESIKVIDGKKYKAIKESKKNPRILKEIYDRTFRSLK